MKNPLNQYILYNDWGDFSRQNFSILLCGAGWENRTLDSYLEGRNFTTKLSTQLLFVKVMKADVFVTYVFKYFYNLLFAATAEACTD